VTLLVVHLSNIQTSEQVGTQSEELWSDKRGLSVSFFVCPNIVRTYTADQAHLRAIGMNMLHPIDIVSYVTCGAVQIGLVAEQSRLTSMENKLNLCRHHGHVNIQLCKWPAINVLGLSTGVSLGPY
jgi:hypothetical protein